MSKGRVPMPPPRKVHEDSRTQRRRTRGDDERWTVEDEMTAADIRRWYQDAGMEYDPEDWGERSDTGESTGPQHQPPQRMTPYRGAGSTSVRSSDSSPGRAWWWEKQAFPWREREYEERQWLELLDDFFAPYLAMMPKDKGNLLRQVYGDLSTYQEVAANEHVAKSTAHEAVQRAVRDVTRLIAEDDPLFRPPIDGRRRDFEEEARAARRVFMVYVSDPSRTR